MIALIVLGLIFMFVVIPLLQMGLYAFLIVCGLMMIGIIGSYIRQSLRCRKEYNALQYLTSQAVLDTLKLEDKKRLARVVESYQQNKKDFSRQFKDTLLYTGLGYTVADIGISKAIRYGVAYGMLRKFRQHLMKDDDMEE